MESDSSRIEKLFQIPYISLGKILAWPTLERSWPQVLLGYFHLIYFFFFVVACFVKAFVTFTDFDVLKFADAIAPGLTTATVMIKLQILFSQRERFNDALEELNGYFSVGFHPKAAEGNQKKAKFLYKANLINYVLPFITAFTYFLVPLIVMLVKKALGAPIVFKLPIYSSWPWDVETSPGYELSYAYLAYVSWVLPNAMTGMDNLVMDLFFYTGSLFDSLAFDIDDLSQVILEKLSLHEDPNPAAGRLLRRLVKKHATAIDYCRKIQDMVTSLTLVQFFCAALQICLVGFIMLAVPGIPAKLTYCSYFMAVFVQQFYFCWGGQVLRDAVSFVTLSLTLSLSISLPNSLF